jgi:steroid delta-isomerase-like uncharacterized protein
MDPIHLVPQLLDAWNSHDIERIVAFYAPDYQGVSVAEAAPHAGPAGVRAFFGRYYQAIPDLHFVTDELVIQNDQLAWFWTAHGTHQGHLMNIPPTGRAVKVHGSSLLTVRDGQVIRGFYLWDVAGLLRAFGLLPDLV